METTPSTPQPFDNDGPSDHEGWNPTPDSTGEVDIPEAEGSGVETRSAPGIAFEPSPTALSTLDGDGRRDGGVATRADAGGLDPRDDELVSLRERLAYYESFDSLIRDSIDRAGALMREAATKQGDAEVRLRVTTRDFERRQTEERSGYRTVFATLLDDVSTLQQQVERMARQVSDALDDLELQLPAAGELSAIERGQALGMSGHQSTTPEPAELPSGASSAAWVTHDGDVETKTSPSTRSGTARHDAEDEDDQVDPEMVEEVLSEYTDADPAVADPAPESARLAAASDLPEEFGLSDPVAGAEIGRTDEPYVERSVATEDDAIDAGSDAAADSQDDHPSATARAEGFYVEHTADADESDPMEDDGSPLKQSAPREIGEVDLGFDAAGEAVEETGPDEEPSSSDATDDSYAPLSAGEADAPYGDQGAGESGKGAGESGIGTDAAAVNGSPTVSDDPGAGEASSTLRRLESEVQRPTQAADDAGEQDTTVLVHGVPRATTALSLKRYLEGLAAVSAVEPREYAEGILRLQVTGDRPIRIADLSAWPDGSGLQEVQVRDDLVEIRLPG